MRLDLGAIPHELLNRFLLYQTSPALAGLFFSGQHLGQQSANLAQFGKPATAKRHPKAPLLARIAVQEARHPISRARKCARSGSRKNRCCGEVQARRRAASPACAAGARLNAREGGHEMRRVNYAASVALITLGTTGLLAERSLALPLPDLRENRPIARVAETQLQLEAPSKRQASCRRWWQWQGARWVRSCWPAGYDPCPYSHGCSPPTPRHPYWRPWGGPPPYRYWFY